MGAGRPHQALVHAVGEQQRIASLLVRRARLRQLAEVDGLADIVDRRAKSTASRSKHRPGKRACQSAGELSGRLMHHPQVRREPGWGVQPQQQLRRPSGQRAQALLLAERVT